MDVSAMIATQNQPSESARCPALVSPGTPPPRLAAQPCIGAGQNPIGFERAVTQQRARECSRATSGR